MRAIILLILMSSLCIVSCTKPVYIYVDDNGIIKASNDVRIGKKYKLNGVKYLIVDNDMLRNMVDNGEDVTKVVTTYVTDMNWMFSRTNFNYDISKWDVSNVIDMDNMFRENSSFNQDISNWDVSNVTIMRGMFFEASSFNQYIGNWDVSNVNDMSRMFVGSGMKNIPVWYKE